MRTRDPSAPVAVVLALLLSPPVEAQLTSVHVDVAGSPAGKGVAVSRGVDCFVLTARHVVEAPRPVRLVGVGRRSSNGTMTWSDSVSDVAAVRVEDPAAICGSDYLVPVSDFWSRIGSASSGVLQVRTELGQEDEIPVVLVPGLTRSGRPDRDIFIRPAESYIDLGQGLSGSLLLVAGLPAGLLVQVSTDGRQRGRVVPLTRISALVESFLPLTVPEDDAARYDPIVAADLLRKNVNYMKTEAFCRALLRMARWIETPETQWEPENFGYQAKRVSGGYEEFDIPSWLLPDRNTRYRVGQDGASRTATTVVGRLPQSLAPGELWDRATEAVDGCVRSDAREEFNLRLNSQDTSHSGEVRWTLERTRFGAVVDDVDIWLIWGATGIEIRVWDLES